MPRKVMTGRITEAAKIEFFSALLEKLRPEMQILLPEYEFIDDSHDVIDWTTRLSAGTKWENASLVAYVTASFPAPPRRRKSDERIIFLSSIARILGSADVQAYVHCDNPAFVARLAVIGSFRGIRVACNIHQVPPKVLRKRKKVVRKSSPPRRVVDLSDG